MTQAHTGLLKDSRLGPISLNRVQRFSLAKAPSNYTFHDRSMKKDLWLEKWFYNQRFSDVCQPHNKHTFLEIQSKFKSLICTKRQSWRSYLSFETKKVFVHNPGQVIVTGGIIPKRCFLTMYIGYSILFVIIHFSWEKRELIWDHPCPWRYFL